MGKLILANFKMNKTGSDISEYCARFLKSVNTNANNFCICPPFTCLDKMVGGLKGRGAVGSQNVYFESKGAYTGEISVDMIKSTGATYALIGHSERRCLMGETNEIIVKKLKFATENGLKVVLCVGEKLEERSKINSVLNAQLKVLKDIDLTKVCIAYEPVWAIGTGVVATTKDIEKAHKIIIDIVKKDYNFNIDVLYGGSVKSANCKDILMLNEVGGALVGGACLDPEEFAKIVNISNEIK